MLAHFTAHADMLDGVEIHVGQTGEVRSLPAVLLYAESARAPSDLGAKPLGNFELTVNVYVYSSADDAPTMGEALGLHRARVEAVQAIMQDVAGLQGVWTQGALYAAWLVSDDEGLAGRRYGNVIQYTLVAVYPPPA